MCKKCHSALKKCEVCYGGGKDGNGDKCTKCSGTGKLCHVHVGDHQ